MYKLLFSRLHALYVKQVPATGVGIFRILFGLVTLQEVLFLIYFNHLIFDPIPFMDVEFPMILVFLCLWALVALALMLGYRCQTASIANYLFWLVFVNFTPMQRDFDGGFDLFMIGANFFLLFMPIDQAFAVDGLRRKLRQPFVHYSLYPRPAVSALVYWLPVAVCLGFLYFDSVIHKMFAEHWRNGLGAWLPSSMPYYISVLDLSWLLNQEYMQKAIGYTIIVFQFTFLFLFSRRRLRPLFFLVGIGLHLGITLSFNIYPFGMGMLACYALIMPFAWYRRLGGWLQASRPALTVYYDQQCPLCCRTVLTLNHFDVLRGVDFRAAQVHGADCPQLRGLEPAELLRDLYAVDARGRVYAGVATYAHILMAMRYTAPLGWLLQSPPIYWYACRRYRQIADNRRRVVCDTHCVPAAAAEISTTWYQRVFVAEPGAAVRPICHKIFKISILLVILQMNSTLHYGVLYRLHVETRLSPITSLLTDASNTLLMFSGSFLGITPHALYLHDHFAGYDHLLAIAYLDREGGEHWLPFVNEEGRLLAPNWGRVHSMWANIAVTPDINELRLKKFIMKVTAFWGIKTGLDLDHTRFIIKMKKITSPVEWVFDLRKQNLSGDWQDIGTAQWHGREIVITLPVDIDAL